MAIKINKDIQISDSTTSLNDLIPKTTQTTSDKNTYSCNYINNRITTTMTLLYDFGDISTYGEGDVFVNISGYDLVVIEATNGYTVVSNCKMGKCHGMIVGQEWTNNADNLLRRKYWKSGENAIHFDKCYGYGINGYSSFGERSNFLVPRYIYGIKL